MRCSARNRRLAFGTLRIRVPSAFSIERMARSRRSLSARPATCASTPKARSARSKACGWSAASASASSPRIVSLSARTNSPRRSANVVPGDRTDVEGYAARPAHLQERQGVAPCACADIEKTPTGGQAPLHFSQRAPVRAGVAAGRRDPRRYNDHSCRTYPAAPAHPGVPEARSRPWSAPRALSPPSSSRQTSCVLVQDVPSESPHICCQHKGATVNSANMTKSVFRNISLDIYSA